MEIQAAVDITVNMAVVAGGVEAIKRAIGPSFSSERFGPLLSLVVGVASATGGTYLGWYEMPIGIAVLQGVIAGLSASGLYRTVTRQA